MGARQQEKLRRLARSLAVGVVVASVLALLAIGTGLYAIKARNEVTKANVGLNAARDDAAERGREAFRRLAHLSHERGQSLTERGDEPGRATLVCPGA